MIVDVEFHPNSSSQLTVSGVKDVSGATVSDATVTAALHRPASTVAVTGVESLSLSATATAGSYSARTPVLGDLPLSDEYVLVVTITKGADTTTYKKKVPVNLP